jgi:hypothetical protein
MNTVPTGLPGVPSSGSVTPVIDSPHAARDRSQHAARHGLRARRAHGAVRAE